MAVFAIVAIKNPPAVLASIREQYGAGFHSFTDNVWFVSDTVSSKAVADKIRLTDGAVGGTGVVMKISAYSGFAPTDNWTWMQQYPEAMSNG